MLHPYPSNQPPTPFLDLFFFTHLPQIFFKVYINYTHKRKVSNLQRKLHVKLIIKSIRKKSTCHAVLMISIMLPTRDARFMLQVRVSIVIVKVLPISSLLLKKTKQNKQNKHHPSVNSVLHFYLSFYQDNKKRFAKLDSQCF